MLHVSVTKAKKAKLGRKSAVVQGNRTAFSTEMLSVFTIVYGCGINAHIQMYAALKHEMAAATIGQANTHFSFIYLLADAS